MLVAPAELVLPLTHIPIATMATTATALPTPMPIHAPVVRPPAAGAGAGAGVCGVTLFWSLVLEPETAPPVVAPPVAGGDDAGGAAALASQVAGLGLLL